MKRERETREREERDRERQNDRDSRETGNKGETERMKTTEGPERQREQRD